MIQSSLQTAEDIATQMGEAADTIQDATNNILSTDDQTTLTVNSHAQKTNQEAFDLTNLFNEGFQHWKKSCSQRSITIIVQKKKRK